MNPRLGRGFFSILNVVLGSGTNGGWFMVGWEIEGRGGLQAGGLVEVYIGLRIGRGGALGCVLWGCGRGRGLTLS